MRPITTNDFIPVTISPRPFKALGNQQVAIGGIDKQGMKTLWVDMLCLTQTGTLQSERENVDEAMKMENILLAAHDGVVGKIVAGKGESLAVDQVILEFQ
eukprot:gene12319-12110_t